MSMLTEIGEQADVVERLLANMEETGPRLTALGGDSTHAVIAARGTSDNAARYAQYVWGARNRLSVALTTPSLFSIYQTPPSLEDAFVVGISQSGESPDLVEVVAEARKQRRPVLVITNEPDSPLASGADVVVDLCAGEETAVAATKTYTAQLAAIAYASAAMGGDGQEAVSSIPSVLRTVLDGADDWAGAINELVDADRCVVVGRGFHHATVHEWALKMQELTYVLAQPYSAADFLHGPVAVVEKGFPVLLVATDGPTFSQMTAIADDLMARGAHVVTISDMDGAPGSVVINLPKVEDWLSPIVVAPVLQLFVHALAVARGQDPDAPRGLSKVTRTR